MSINIGQLTWNRVQKKTRNSRSTTGWVETGSNGGSCIATTEHFVCQGMQTSCVSPKFIPPSYRHKFAIGNGTHFAETSASLMSYPGDEDVPGSTSPRIGPFRFRCGAPEKACMPLADACLEAEIVPSTRNLLLPHVRMEDRHEHDVAQTGLL